MSYKDTKISLEERAKILPDTEKNNLLLFLEKTKTSPRWYATNSYNVRYKNGIIYRFRILDNGSWTINFTLAKPCDLDETLNALPVGDREFYFRNIRRCRHCNPAHGNGRRFVILGDEYWGCAEPEIEITNPTASDVDMLCKFTEMRKQNILRHFSK